MSWMKSQLMTLLIIMFSIFIKFYECTSSFITKLLSIFISSSSSYLLTNLSLYNTKLKVHSQQKISTYLLIIFNSSISLYLSIVIVQYHDIFTDAVLFFTKYVHQTFLFVIFPSIKAQLENFAKENVETISFMQNFKIWVCYVYIFLGYFGVSAQISLTLDLLLVFNSPTIYIYRMLSWAYSNTIFLLQNILLILQTDKQHYVTFKYKPFLLKKSLTIVYLGLIALLLQSLIVIIFYYLWLAFVICLFKTFINLLQNMVKVIHLIAKSLLIFKGITFQRQKMKFQKISFKKAIQILRQEIQKQSFIAIFDIENIISIFKGKNILSSPQKISQNLPSTKSVSISQIYKLFIKLSKIKI